MRKKNIRHKVFNYVAIFDPAKEGGFNVSFPELPGCVTFGRTFEEAQVKAAEVLELWLEELTVRNQRPYAKKRRLVIGEVEVAIRVQ
ncbi:MAG: type II toxin-antitoxin system HicB family antitoxin [bacterium]|nr:type II toxin-antitoxin system HicB family antitoxin [bacterium]